MKYMKGALVGPEAHILASVGRNPDVHLCTGLDVANVSYSILVNPLTLFGKDHFEADTPPPFPPLTNKPVVLCCAVDGYKRAIVRSTKACRSVECHGFIRHFVARIRSSVVRVPRGAQAASRIGCGRSRGYCGGRWWRCCGGRRLRRWSCGCLRVDDSDAQHLLKIADGRDTRPVDVALFAKAYAPAVLDDPVFCGVSDDAHGMTSSERLRAAAFIDTARVVHEVLRYAEESTEYWMLRPCGPVTPCSLRFFGITLLFGPVFRLEMGIFTYCILQLGELVSGGCLGKIPSPD